MRWFTLPLFIVADIAFVAVAVHSSSLIVVFAIDATTTVAYDRDDCDFVVGMIILLLLLLLILNEVLLGLDVVVAAATTPPTVTSGIVIDDWSSSNG